MLHFAVGFDITPSCRGGRSKPKTRWNQKWAAGPHKSKITQRSERQVPKSDPSELRWKHPQDKAQAEGGGLGKTTQAKSRREYTALYAKCLPDLSLRSLRKNSSFTAKAENWWYPYINIYRYGMCGVYMVFLAGKNQKYRQLRCIIYIWFWPTLLTAHGSLIQNWQLQAYGKGACMLAGRHGKWIGTKV